MGQIEMARIKSFGIILVQNFIFLLLLLAIGFILPRVIPGSPIFSDLDSIHVFNANMPEEAFNRFNEYYAPQKGLLEQFRIYLGHLLRMDLGYSFNFGLPVAEIISGRLGWTLFISIVSILMSYLIAVPIGILSGLKKGRAFDYVSTLFFIIVEAVPIFLIALLLQHKLGYRLRLLPTQGAYPIGIVPGEPGYIRDVLLHGIMPITAVVISMLPSTVILTRNIISRVAREPFVELAYYNNIKPVSIISAYLLKNSMPELLSKLNIQFIYAVAGVMFVEIIFSYPGMGLLLKTAVASRDYCLIQGVFLVVGCFGIGVNTIFGWINSQLFPRYEV